MLQYVHFVPGFDAMEVVPGLSISLSEAIQTGTVKDIGVASAPNGIEDVDSVGSLVRDAFEAFDAMHNVQNDRTGAFVNAIKASQGVNPTSE